MFTYLLTHFVCVFSLHTIFFLLQLLCTNIKKAAVQPSLQYKQLETKDSIQKTKIKRG